VLVTEQRELVLNCRMIRNEDAARAAADAGPGRVSYPRLSIRRAHLVRRALLAAVRISGRIGAREARERVEHRQPPCLDRDSGILPRMSARGRLRTFGPRCRSPVASRPGNLIMRGPTLATT